jgi:GMP synthase (glutamine-hydrolysing)
MEGTAKIAQSDLEAKSTARNGGATEAKAILKTERGGIVVLDFGGQYTQLIARRVREQQVFSSVLPCKSSLEEIRRLEPAGIILSGGPSSVYDKDAPVCDPAVLGQGIPVLGICYGMQWMAKNLGGKVEPVERREYGPAHFNLEKAESHILGGLPETLKIWASHGDNVLELPPGFHLTGKTANAIASAEDHKRKMYAVQFHP